MPLVDHFHPPVSRTHSWESFHSRWVVTLADALNNLADIKRLSLEYEQRVLN